MYTFWNFYAKRLKRSTFNNLNCNKKVILLYFAFRSILTNSNKLFNIFGSMHIGCNPIGQHNILAIYNYTDMGGTIHYYVKNTMIYSCHTLA